MQQNTLINFELDKEKEQMIREVSAESFMLDE